jgi:hypothetical protein
MTPQDLGIVESSWSELRLRRAALVAALAARFQPVTTARFPATVRAVWLFDAVGELVRHLSAPSRLAADARVFGETWPDPCTAPSFAVEGRAWLAAAAECLPTWTPAADTAWRQAWLLLSDSLAAEALSPFAADPIPQPN